MAKQGVKSYRGNEVDWVCGICEHLNTDTITKDSNRMPEYQEYENYSFQCTACSGFIVINMNIPESDFDEFDIEVEHMNYFEMNARKQIRDMIFERRQDMKALKAADKKQKRDKGKENAAQLRSVMHAVFVEETQQKRKKEKQKEQQKKSRGNLNGQV